MSLTCSRRQHEDEDVAVLSIEVFQHAASAKQITSQWVPESSGEKEFRARDVFLLCAAASDLRQGIVGLQTCLMKSFGLLKLSINRERDTMLHHSCGTRLGLLVWKPAGQKSRCDLI